MAVRRPGRTTRLTEGCTTDGYPADRYPAARYPEDGYPTDGYPDGGGYPANDDAYPREPGGFRDTDSLWKAWRILNLADGQVASITQQTWVRVNAIHEAAEREVAAVRQQAGSQIVAIRDAAEREAAAILALPGGSGRAGPAPELAPRQRAALPAPSAGIPAGQPARPAAPVRQHATPVPQPGAEYLPPDLRPPGPGRGQPRRLLEDRPGPR